MFYHVLEVKSNAVTVIPCDEDGTIAESAEEIECFLKDGETCLPYLNSEVCYEFTINTDQQPHVICGCSSIVVPKQKDFLSVVTEVITMNTAGRIKTKLEDTAKKLHKVDFTTPDVLSVCTDVISRTFDKNIADLVKQKVSSMKDVCSRDDKKQILEFFFCMGFHDKRAVKKSIEMVSGGPAELKSTVSKWFMPLGYGAKSEKIEDYVGLYAPFRTRDKDFMEHIAHLSRENPDRFFNLQTRPMSLRSLGEMNVDFFKNFCSVEFDHHIERTMLFIENRRATEGSRIVRVANQDVSEDAVGLIRTLVELSRKHLLFVKRDIEIAEPWKQEIGPKCQDLCLTMNGRANRINEFHAFGLTDKLSLRFDATDGAVDKETLKRRFVQSTTPAEKNIIAFYVREAHALSFAQLSHLLWRMGSRSVFKSLTLTTKFCYDTIYSGSIAPLIDRLREKDSEVCPYVFKSDRATVENLSEEKLDDLVGVCVVPAADDARDADESMPVGAQVFCVKPPCFGRVAKTSQANKLHISLNGEPQTIVVPIFLHQKRNVWKSKRTRKGFLVPVSSLMSQKKKIPFCTIEANIMIPSSFSVWERAEIEYEAVSFFRKYKVYDVMHYLKPSRDIAMISDVLDVLKMI